MSKLTKISIPKKIALSGKSNTSNNSDEKSDREEETIKNNILEDIYNDDNDKSKKKKKKKSKSKLRRKSIICSEPWNKGIQLLLKKIGEKAMGYKWMLNKEKEYYEHLDGIYSKAEIITLSLLAIITGGEFVGALADVGIRGNTITIVVVTIVQLFMIALYAIIKGIKDSQNYQKKIIEYNNLAGIYNEINIKIQLQFSYTINERKNDKEFAKKMTTLYNQAFNDTPIIRKKTRDKYIKYTKDINIHRPLIIGEFDNIEIVVGKDNTTKIGNQENDIESQTESSSKSYNINDHNLEIARWLKNF